MRRCWMMLDLRMINKWYGTRGGEHACFGCGKLIFFRVAVWGHFLDFCWKQGSSHYSWAVLFCFSFHPSVRRLWGKSWERTQLGQVTPTDTRDIPDHTGPCSAYKPGRRRRRKQRMFWAVVLVFSSVTHDKALLSREWVNICLPIQKLWIN